MRRRRTSNARRLRGLLRLLSIFVLVMLCAQTALAYALPCVASDDCGESCPGQDDERRCPCPIDCASCCAGNALRAIPPTVPVVDLPTLVWVEVLPLWIELAPPAADPAEILHVPKPCHA